MAVLNSYGPAIDILNSGAIDTERMVSDTYTLDQFPEAVAHVRAGKGMKVQVAGTSDRSRVLANSARETAASRRQQTGW